MACLSARSLIVYFAVRRDTDSEDYYPYRAQLVDSTILRLRLMVMTDEDSRRSSQGSQCNTTGTTSATNSVAQPYQRA